jgi:small-conductance mechanosensitive channel
MDLAWFGDSVWGNSLKDWLAAGVVAAAALAAALFFKTVVLARLKALAERTDTDLDDTLVGALSAVRFGELTVVAVAVGARSLYLPAGVERALHLSLLLVLGYRAAALLQAALVAFWRSATAEVPNGDPTSRSALRNAEYVLGGVVWLGAVLFVLDNLGVNITTAVAGLGIGGIAVAMAAQQLLGDLFSSFVIFMDKPFKVGDFIIVDGLTGTVENVGLKTTQVRSLSGELLVFPNSDLTKARIRNFKQMRERRVAFGFGILYETPRAKVAAVPEMVREIFATLPKTRLDRVHFSAFGESSLDFEVVFYVLDADYNLYMDLQQAANLALMERFEREAIAFAYPTRTLYLNKTV